MAPASFEMAAKIGTSRNLAQLAEPWLQELVRLTGESANLAAIEGDEVVYLAHVDAPRVVRMFTEVGSHVPLHASGTGKAILACMDRGPRSQILAGRQLTRYTARTITDRRSPLWSASVEWRTSSAYLSSVAASRAAALCVGPFGTSTLTREARRKITYVIASNATPEMKKRLP